MKSYTIKEFFKLKNKDFKIGEKIIVTRKEFDGIYERIDKRNYSNSKSWKLIEKMKSNHLIEQLQQLNEVYDVKDSLCTCKPDCPTDCKGQCGCERCWLEYQDFLSTE